MGEALITRRGGGGANLNFSVNQYPSSTDLSQIAGKENEIAVLTDIPFSEWAISPTEPVNPANNMIWVKTGTSSRRAIEILKKNSIMLYLQGVYQHVSGAWTRRKSYIYQSGEWHDMDIFLFDRGDKCTLITGGWDSRGQANNYFYDTYALMQISAGYANAFTTNKVNLSGYTKLCAKINLVRFAASVDNSLFRLALTETAPTTNAPPPLVTVERSDTLGEQTVELDISAYKNGEYYIHFGGGYAFTCYIYEVWLE